MFCLYTRGAYPLDWPCWRTQKFAEKLELEEITRRCDQDGRRRGTEKESGGLGAGRETHQGFAQKRGSCIEGFRRIITERAGRAERCIHPDLSHVDGSFKIRSLSRARVWTGILLHALWCFISWIADSFLQLDAYSLRTTFMHPFWLLSRPLFLPSVHLPKIPSMTSRCSTSSIGCKKPRGIAS